MTETAAVITCSDTRDAAGDVSGAALRDLLHESGFHTAQPVIVADEVAPIGAAITAAIDAGARIVVTTGGTGIGPRDVTPEALAALSAAPVPGIGEAMRAAARDRVPSADLSRGGAWTLRGSLVLALPGSPGGVRDGWQVAGPLLAHALTMLGGGAHPGAESPASWVGPDPIDAAAVTRTVTRDAAGAVVTFEGRVRDHDGGRTVTSLRYEGHPDADTALRDVVAQAGERPGVLAATARHRVGPMAIGDLVFLVAVAAAHRGEAFDACAWLVDEAKARLPIWKFQEFADGTTEWVNCP